MPALQRLFALLLGLALLGLASLAATPLRSALDASPALSLIDAASERAYRIERASGRLLVLNLHGGVSQLASLPDPALRKAETLRLDSATGRLYIDTPERSLLLDTARLEWLGETPHTTVGQGDASAPGS